MLLSLLISKKKDTHLLRKFISLFRTSCLRSRVFGLDLSDLRYSSSAAIAVLVRWSYGALARRLPDCLLQQVVPDSGDGGPMTAARLRLASVPVVVARWSMDLDVIFIISGIRCTAMIGDE